MNDIYTPQSQNPSASGGQNQPTPPPAAASTFWSRHSTALIRMAIVAIIIIGAVIYSRTQRPAPTQETPSPTATTPATTTLPLVPTDAAKPGTTTLPASPKPTAPPQTAPTPRLSAGAVTVAAQRGNGYTHLARRALAAHLQSKPQAVQLKPEHKIYIEDYLQKRLVKRTPLTTGTEVTFQQTDIDQAIDRALKLNERQLQNLNKYTLRVKNL